MASSRTKKVSRGFEIGDPIFSTGTAAVDKKRMIESFGKQYATARVVGEFLGKTGNRTYRVKWTNLKNPYENEYGVNHSIFDDPANPRAGKRSKNSISAPSAPSSTDIGATVSSGLHDPGSAKADSQSKVGVKWDYYAEMTGGGGKRLTGHTKDVDCLALCDGLVCSGDQNGSIRVWNVETLKQERMLRVEGQGSRSPVCALAFFEGYLISGYFDGRLRVWNTLTGECEQVIDGHQDAVKPLMMCGPHLVSGSLDRTIKIWAAGRASRWVCKRSLQGHAGWIGALATWEGKVISGSCDRTIRVWDLGTGAHEATLVGNTDAIYALAVAGDRLFSASGDGMIREWSLRKGTALRTMLACDARAWGLMSEHIGRLVVSGTKLVSGSCGGLQAEVRVWDLKKLKCEQKLVCSGRNTHCLLAADGEVWGGVDKEVVVWGRD